MTHNVKPPKKASSIVHSHGYDPQTRTLLMHFHKKDGKSEPYRYTNVPPEIAAGLDNADSAGKFFAANIRGKFSHAPVPEAK